MHRNTGMWRAAVAAVAAIGLGGMALQTGTSSASSSIGRAVLHDQSGNTVGEVVFKQRGGEIVGQAEVWLPADSAEFHGFHIHANDVDNYPAVPDGDPADGCQGTFASVDGHWALAGQSHGGHAGDLPVLMRSSDGHAEVEVVIGKFTPEDVIGRAVVVHVGPDNYGNIPTRYTAEGATGGGPDATTLATGDAGGRYACGVIEARSS